MARIKTVALVLIAIACPSLLPRTLFGPRRREKSPIWLVLHGGVYGERWIRGDRLTRSYSLESERTPGVFDLYEAPLNEAGTFTGATIECHLHFVCRIDGRELPIDHRHNAE